MTRTRLLLAVLAVVSLGALFTTRVSRKMPDFEVYWTAGSRAAHAAPLYREADGHYQFKYLPAFAVLATPIALIPLPAAKGLWFGVSSVLMVVLLGLSVSAIGRTIRAPALLVVLTFCAMAKFYAHELVLGQVNLLFAVLVAGAVVLLTAGQRALAGGLLALAVVVKPYGILFAPWLLSRRDKLPFLWMTGFLILALLLPAVRYGWMGDVQLHQEWWRTVTATTAPNLGNQDNISFAGFFDKWFPGLPAATTFAALTSALLLGLIAIVIAGRGQLPSPDPLEAGLILLAIPLLSPQGWDYVLLIATPAVMLLIDRLGAVPRTLRVPAAAAVAVIALAIYDLLGRDRYAQFMALGVITICAVLEFAALVSLRFRRVA